MPATAPSDGPLTIRTLTEADLTTFSELVATAFLQDFTDEYIDAERTVFEPDRAHGVFDGETLVGCGEILSRRITLPDTGPTPFAAVTAIAVAPGHRRRGALNMIMRTQLEGLRDTGEPVAALWASESGIYGRFGYGLATQHIRLNIPKGTPFRPGVELAAGRVRELPREQALPLIKEIYDKVAATQVGQLSRSAGDWEYRLHEAEFFRRGQTKYRFAVHPEAFAVYRARLEWQDRGPNSAVAVRDVVATNPAAYAAIYRYLLDIDLVGEVSISGPMDCPIVHLLADPRAATRASFDALWVRIVDVDRALAARHYGVPVDVVLEVSDEFCPWNTGRWRLTVNGEGRPTVRRTDQAADLALHADDLGAAFLGGTRLTTLAEAGRVRELTPGSLARTSLAFLHDHEPACLEIF